MKWTRIIGIWLIIIVTETVHGILRTLYITPIIGDHAARQIGVPIGSLLILMIAWLTVRWMGAQTLKEHFAIGGVWVFLTVIFEFVLGMMLHYPLSRILSDYDITRGGFMVLGLMFMFFSPLIAAKIR